MMNKLYWKISIGLLGLLTVLGVIYILITAYIGKNYVQEINQRLYGSIADTTVHQVRPLVNGEVDTAAVQEIMHSLMVINPSLEVYLLDTEGNIITYVAPYKRVQLEKVALGPVIEFIEKKEEKPFIKGDDPRNPGEQKVFSAAPIIESEQLAGYMYIILDSEEQASVSSALSGSYMLQLGSTLFFLALMGALIIGLLAIWLLTRNLRHIIRVVRRFQEGHYEARIEKKHLGELPPLGATFNEMADTIVANIEQLKSVETLRRELIANVSHDLRTPLAVIQGYAETMQIKDRKLDEQERAQFLKTIMNSTGNLKRLIEQLFEYSKLEARQIQPEKEPFFISELAQDSLQKYELLSKEKNISLCLEVPEKLPLVFADIGLVERVFQNLLDNALKFTPPGGQVSLSLSTSGNQVEVHIVDSGPGIPEEQQAFVFDRYYQNGKSPNKKKGAGLGLAIVKKILELHDSSISVKSRIKEGTAFIFQLPVYTSLK
jgi:signal transduction histidine kinase